MLLLLGLTACSGAVPFPSENVGDIYGAPPPENVGDICSAPPTDDEPTPIDVEAPATTAPVKAKGKAPTTPR